MFVLYSVCGITYKKNLIDYTIKKNNNNNKHSSPLKITYDMYLTATYNGF